MFYDKSEPDFPQWWDLLDADGADAESAELFAADEIEEARAAGESERDEADDAGFGGYAEDDRELPGFRAGEGLGGPRGYEREVIRSVWRFAEIVPGTDPELWRRDEFGDWICRLDYGRRHSRFGWEIFDPGAGRHAQGVYAMRPMQWRNFVEQYESLG